jgi:hypothetical protein
MCAYYTRQGLSESPSYDFKWPSVRKKMGGGQQIHFSVKLNYTLEKP